MTVRIAPTRETSGVQLYDQDFYAWANQQAALLRAGQLALADIEHIAEEIESTERSAVWPTPQPGRAAHTG